LLIIPAGVVAVSVSGCRTWLLCLHGVMRTQSNRAPEYGLCGARMKKNGHDRLGRQRWMCPGCRTTGATRGLPGRHRVPACEWACYMKSAKPDPYRFAIPDGTTPHPPTPKQTEPSTETPQNPAPQSNGLTCTCPSSTPEREIQSNNFGSYMPT